MIKKIFNLITLLVILLNAFSCKQTSKENKHIASNYTIAPSKKYIKFDNRNSYYYSFLTQIVDNNTILRKINKISKNGFEYYYLDKKNKKTIVLNEDKVRELKRVRGFFYKNEDSIFVIGLNKFIIIDNKNNILANKFYNNPENNNYFPISVTTQSPVFVSNNILHFTKLVDVPPGKEYYQTNCLMGFDLKKDSLFAYQNTNYPPIYNDKCYLSNELSFDYTIVNKDTIVINYPIDNSLYMYSLKKQKVLLKKEAKSQYKLENVKNTDCNKVWDTKTYWKHIYTSYLYSGIIYDKYRDIYYRFLKLPKKDYNLNTKHNSLNIPFIITVLDNKLNIIAESKPINEKPNYIPFDYFVNKDGLWVSKNNPENPEYDEDKLVFELFKLNTK